MIDWLSLLNTRFQHCLEIKSTSPSRVHFTRCSEKSQQVLTREANLELRRRKGRGERVRHQEVRRLSNNLTRSTSALYG